jgi:hypothetical protein
LKPEIKYSANLKMKNILWDINVENVKISIHLTWPTIEIKPWSLIIIFQQLGHVENVKRENLLCCRFYFE